MADDDTPADTRAAAGHGFTALSLGTRLSDRYRIDHVIAHGGFGITYGGRHEGLNRIVAIKEHFPRQFAYRDGITSAVRPSDPGTYAWALDRFLAEGRALATCKHPHVVDVSDVFEANGTAYMVLGYEEGQSFAAWLAALGRPPTQAELDAILAPLLDALAFVHEKGLLHRDIAPDNIMIRSDGKPCLIDFGAARHAMAQRSQVMSAIIKTGYSPPEQYTTTGRNQGPWSDIYAFGATLYRAVTGAVPPEATERTLGDTMRSAVEAARGVGYRLGFLAAIDAALRVPTAERPQSVPDLRGMLWGTSAAPVGRSEAAPSATEVRHGAGDSAGVASDLAGPAVRARDAGPGPARSDLRTSTLTDLPRPPVAPKRGRAPKIAGFAIIALFTVGGWYGLVRLPAQHEMDARAATAKEAKAKAVFAARPIVAVVPPVPPPKPPDPPKVQKPAESPQPVEDTTLAIGKPAGQAMAPPPANKPSTFDEQMAKAGLSADDAEQSPLLNKDPRQKPSMQSTASADSGAKRRTASGPRDGAVARVPQSDTAVLARQLADMIKSCYRAHPGYAVAQEDKVVKLRFDLGPDGILKGEPIVLVPARFNLATNWAVSALKACQPYRLDPDMYQGWKEWDFEFTP